MDATAAAPVAASPLLTARTRTRTRSTCRSNAHDCDRGIARARLPHDWTTSAIFGTPRRFALTFCAGAAISWAHQAPRPRFLLDDSCATLWRIRAPTPTATVALRNHRGLFIAWICRTYGYVATWKCCNFIRSKRDVYNLRPIKSSGTDQFACWFLKAYPAFRVSLFRSSPQRSRSREIAMTSANDASR